MWFFLICTGNEKSLIHIIPVIKPGLVIFNNVRLKYIIIHFIELRQVEFQSKIVFCKIVVEKAL